MPATPAFVLPRQLRCQRCCLFSRELEHEVLKEPIAVSLHLLIETDRQSAPRSLGDRLYPSGAKIGIEGDRVTLHLSRSIQREFARLLKTYTRLAADRAHREAREIVSWIHPWPDERVLDAACGPATLARAMAPFAAQVYGLDLCPPMIQAARKLQRNPNSPLFFTVGVVERLPYRNQSFQLVTCAYSFANFPDPLRVLQEFARVTRRGGRIAVIDVVAPEDVSRRAYLNHLEALRGHIYTRFLSRAEFVNLFRRARLRLESSRLQRRRRHFRDWLRLSPGAANPQRAHRLWQMLVDSIEGNKAGLNPRRVQGDIVFYHTTAWFLLRRD